MNCPKCNAAWTIVSAIDPVGGDEVAHTRSCPECGHTFQTVELYLEDFERMAFRAANFQTIVSVRTRGMARALVDRHER